MKTSVDDIFKLLERSGLKKPEEIELLVKKWHALAKQHVRNVAQLCRWLVAKKIVTQYQMRLLAAGYSDHFFLNEYTILDRIGMGKMAGVYKAKHWVGHTVAIKVLPPSKAKDPLVFTRFRRESRLAIKLKHANLVRTFERDESDGLHYLVMELLEGETLADLLARCHRLPPGEAIDVVHQALLGLQHVYEQNVVHRDLDPSNLMLIPEPHPDLPDHKGPTVKILDVGLARSLFEDVRAVGEEDGVTVAGEVIGKPEYMAPEQAKDSHAADIRADIYSLGCVLYHAVTGQPPFVADNAVKLLISHAKDTPRPLAEFVPNVRDGLQSVVSKMLAKEPAQRYPTPDLAAQALLQTLKAPKKAKRTPAPTYVEEGERSVLMEFQMPCGLDRDSLWKYLAVIEKEGKGQSDDEE